MKRKRILAVIGIVIVILLAVLLLPRLLNPTTTQPTLAPLSVNHPPIPIIVDDDGSPDGMIALLYFLQHPGYDVRAITVSAGEAHPDIFAERLVDLLAQIDHTDIPIGAGSPDPLQGDNAFPDSWRSSSDNFWDVRLEPAQSDVRVAPAAELMVEILSASEEPVALFVSGTHTNLAEALRLDPGIREHISGVFIMGGSVYAPGNVGSESSAIPNETAEWNIYVDPLAASEVFASGLELHLVPLDATNQVQWSAADTQTWGTSDSPISALAVQVMQNSLGRWSPGGTNIWDLVTAVTASDPSLCKETHLPLEIVLEKGPDEGQTRLTEGTPNVYVCLEPDAEQIKARAAQVFGQ